MTGLDKVVLRGEELRYYEAAADGKLIYAQCAECGHVAVHPRWICTTCGSRQMNEHESARQGEIWSASTMQRSADPNLPAPYQVAIVRLDEGFTIMCLVADGEHPLGTRVQIDFELSPPFAVPVAHTAPSAT